MRGSQRISTRKIGAIETEEYYPEKGKFEFLPDSFIGCDCESCPKFVQRQHTIQTQPCLPAKILFYMDVFQPSTGEFSSSKTSTITLRETLLPKLILAPQQFPAFHLTFTLNYDSSSY